MAIKASGVQEPFFLALHTLLIRIKAMEKKELYSDLLLSLKSLIEEAPNEISVFSNASALLFMSLDDLNWAGFYFLDEKEEELFLGPFQGKVACQTIMVGRGVCGTSVKEERTLRVDDVHKFKASFQLEKTEGLSVFLISIPLPSIALTKKIKKALNPS